MANDLNAVMAQIEDFHGRDPNEHRQQRAENDWGEALEDDHKRKRANSHQERQCTRFVQFAEQVPQLLKEVSRAGGDAKQLWQLPDDDRERETDDKALEHRLGNEIRQEPE